MSIWNFLLAEPGPLPNFKPGDVLYTPQPQVTVTLKEVDYIDIDGLPVYKDAE